MGIWPPENRGSSTAVLESVHLIGVIPGTRVLGIRVTPCGLRSDQGFPPEHVCDRAPLDPVAGYLDRPGPPPSGVRIVVGISAPRRGTFGFAGVSLTYRVGTRQYRAIYVQGGSSAAEETAGAARSTVRSSRSSISWRTAGSTRPKR